MKMHKKLNMRAGFTMVELCITLAIMSIIITMVTTFIMYSNNQRNQITKESLSIQEITYIQNAVNSWLKTYDSASYNITADGTKLQAFKDTSAESDITFENKIITVNGRYFPPQKPR